MGKGDKKSKRGKIVAGSYGVRRQKRKKRYVPVAETKTAKKKAPVEEPKKEKPVARKATSKSKKKESAGEETPPKEQA